MSGDPRASLTAGTIALWSMHLVKYSYTIESFKYLEIIKKIL